MCVFFNDTHLYIAFAGHSQANYHKNNKDAEGTKDYVASHSEIVFFQAFIG
jgi:hypothetical protein